LLLSGLVLLNKSLYHGGLYNFTVYWGDGSSNVITDYQSPNVTHIYPSTSSYTIIMIGIIRGIAFALYDTAANSNILEVLQWGSFSFGKQSTFASCQKSLYYS
jgi:hypothetical protein